MPVETKLTCSGCTKHVSTPAMKPQDWPSGWSLWGEKVYHNEDCYRSENARKDAVNTIAVSLKVLGIKPSELLEAARVCSQDKRPSSIQSFDLANLVLRMLGKED